MSLQKLQKQCCKFRRGQNVGSLWLQSGRLADYNLLIQRPRLQFLRKQNHLLKIPTGK